MSTGEDLFQANMPGMYALSRGAGVYLPDERSSREIRAIIELVRGHFGVYLRHTVSNQKGPS